jgi:hypothetical protein
MATEQELQHPREHTRPDVSGERAFAGVLGLRAGEGPGRECIIEGGVLVSTDAVGHDRRSIGVHLQAARSAQHKWLGLEE